MGWKKIDNEAPEDGQPCEYIISVICKGWYKPENDEVRMVPDDRETPSGQITEWREWKDADSFEEGQEKCNKFRESIKK